MFAKGILLCIFAVCYAEKLKFDIHVLENQERYVQNVHADLYNNHVFYLTPAHGRVLESHILQDFNRGLQLVCMPSIKECHISALDKHNYPNAGNTTESIAHMWNKGVNTIVDTTATKVENKVFRDGPAITNTAYLSKEFQDMLAKFGFTLYKVSPLPKDAMVVNTTMTARKRQASINTLPLNCGNKMAEMRYGYSDATICAHIFLCQGRPSPDPSGIGLHCNNRHVTTDMYYHCLCCPGYYNLDDGKHCQCHKYDPGFIIPTP